MTHTQDTAEQNNQEQARRDQDLECLILLQQAQQLRMETEYLDRQFAALKGRKNELDALDFDDDTPEVRSK